MVFYRPGPKIPGAAQCRPITKIQVAVNQALRVWFEGARGGADGVATNVLIDAVIMLGLNHDIKKVNAVCLHGFSFSQGYTIKTGLEWLYVLHTLPSRASFVYLCFARRCRQNRRGARGAKTRTLYD